MLKTAFRIKFPKEQTTIGGRKMSKKALGIIGCLVGIVIFFAIIMAFYLIGTYNGFVKLDESVKTAWSQVENQLQRRNDLIPNLVNSVKGYAKHEKEIFENVAKARASLAGAQTIGGKIKAANQMSGFLGRLLAVVENYPQLKANTNFSQLMDELSGTENRISVERKRYNDTVKKYNQNIRVFPKNMLAGFFNFKKAQLFEAAEQAKAVPKVDFAE